MGGAGLRPSSDARSRSDRRRFLLLWSEKLGGTVKYCSIGGLRGRSGSAARADTGVDIVFVVVGLVGLE